MKNLIIAALVAALAVVGGLAYAGSVNTTADVDVTAWKGVSSGDIYLSTRPAGGSWTTHNTPLDLTALSSSGRFYQGSAITVTVPVAVDVPDTDASEGEQTPSVTEEEEETEVAGYWHAHCARNRVSGGCDQRFRPSYYPNHFHPNSVPRHTQGEHEDD